MIDELMFADGLVSDDELQHYGVAKRSGRYPWGSGENPYHHGASSPFGRIRERRLEKKKAAAKSAQLEKARAHRDAADLEKKQAALKSGSAKELMPYLRDLSDDELRIAKNRIQMEVDFRNLAVKEAAAGNPKVALAMAKAERITNQANTAINTYNTAAKVYNAFSKSGELPIIGSRGRKEILKTAKDSAYNRIDNQRNKEEIFKKRQAETRKAEAEADRAELQVKELEDEIKKKKQK